jgi:hypothetical protein
MPDAPEIVRESPEIDAFPKNAKIWEVTKSQADARRRKAGRFGTHRRSIRTEFSISPDARLLHRRGRRDDGQATERMAWSRNSHTNRSRREDRNRHRASPRGSGGIEDYPARSAGPQVRRSDSRPTTIRPRSCRKPDRYDRPGASGSRTGRRVHQSHQEQARRQALWSKTTKGLVRRGRLATRSAPPPDPSFPRPIRSSRRPAIWQQPAAELRTSRQVDNIRKAERCRRGLTLEGTHYCGLSSSDDARRLCRERNVDRCRVGAGVLGTADRSGLGQRVLQHQFQTHTAACRSSRRSSLSAS